MNTILRFSALAIALLAPWTLSAHHSFNMFAMDVDETYTGVVERYDWRNPHVHIIIRIDPGEGVDPGDVGRWDVEGGSTVIMGRQGWNRATYRPGDPITLVGHPLKNGEKGISLFYAVKEDGTRLYHDIARPEDDHEQ
jgi:hypothetical protein